MLNTLPSVLLAASLSVLSGAGALAQSTPGHDPATRSSKSTQTDANPTKPGATGDAVVRGDDSTLAGDRAATTIQRDGQE
jgi:hypothetical protein